MKKYFLGLLLGIFLLFTANLNAHAVEFELLVLPVDLFSVCENYFCFPEVSDIIADDVIKNMAQYEHIHTKSLSQLRSTLEKHPDLKAITQAVLKRYKETDKIDFPKLKVISDAFGVKSVLLINSYAINDKTELRRNLWDILEIASAFKITYPFELKTSAVLTDSVNNIVMWSGKYTKDVSDSFGYYSASSQTQAMSQLEKIMLYSSETISRNISQNVFMRFFPREVRTFSIRPTSNDKSETKKFIPNALEHLSDPHLLKEFESETNKDFRKFGNEDFIFEF